MLFIKILLLKNNRHAFAMEAIMGTSSLVFKNCCILQPNPECLKGTKKVWERSLNVRECPCECGCLCVWHYVCFIMHKQRFNEAVYLLVWFLTIDFHMHLCMWALLFVHRCEQDVTIACCLAQKAVLSAVKKMSRAGQGQFAPAMTDREALIHSKAIFLHKRHENQVMYIMIYILVHDSLPQAQSVKHGTYSII